MFNPERLTLARNRRGLKKAKLARLVGVVPRTISDYEFGRTEPSAETLDRLSRELRFPGQFFSRPLDELMVTDAASFRALSRMTASQRDAALAVGTLGIELNRWIEAEFELPEPQIPDLQPGLIDPEGAAALVRSRWGISDEEPISNMLHLLETHGVRVFSLADECREVDAFSAWVAGTPYVCLATYKTPERAIFDAAHELGHLVLHRDDAAPRGRAEERQADEFASNFLMPAADIIAHGPRNPSFADLVEAKERWRVSVAALNYRLHKLDRTSEWHYRELCIEISHFGRGSEPNPVVRERSSVLEKVFSELRKEGMTRADIAGELDLYQEDLDAITFGLALTALDGGASGPPGTHTRRDGHLHLVT